MMMIDDDDDDGWGWDCIKTYNSFAIFVPQLKVDSKLAEVLIGCSDCIC